MGIAILSGILSSLPFIGSGPSHTPQLQTPARFIACVRRQESAARVRSALSNYLSSITILENDNLGGVSEADVVLLACKPAALTEVLGARGISTACRGKLLISILAGVPAVKIEEALYGSGSDPLSPPSHSTERQAISQARCQIVCAMPNAAASVRSSITVIAEPSSLVPKQASELVAWIFERIGHVKYVRPELMAAATVLCAATPAFAALFLEALVSGAKSAGLRDEDATEMAAYSFQGLASLVLSGEKPEALRRMVASKGGVTEQGLQVLEESKMSEIVSRAVHQSIDTVKSNDN
ncbi:delta 1-pyrroline-5-carboxylate reductase [Trapelia coarctata]|nr:delta 1-pyrroline-5-carboxylate reductase [Trapelia coarctata]